MLYSKRPLTLPYISEELVSLIDPGEKNQPNLLNGSKEVDNE
jgi:hypothetical protein